jgi:Ca2+-binding RTX toxin-like protein
MPRTVTGRVLRPLITFAALAALAPSAQAATSLELRSGRLDITGDAFANEIRVTRVEQGLRVSDTKANLKIEAPAPCFLLDDRSAECRLDAATPLRIAGAAGADRLQADANVPADVELVGENGEDVLQGGGGDDRLSGGNGHDELRGGMGNDVLTGGGGPDLLSGQLDIDTISYADHAAGVVVELPDDGDTTNDNGNASDRVLPAIPPSDTIDDSAERVIGSPFDDTIEGNEADNLLTGGAGRDVLQGEEGDDRLVGGPGPDLLAGGLQFDTAVYSERTAPVEVTLGSAAVSGNAEDGAPGQRDRINVDVEGAQGGLAADVLSGDADDNLLRGGPGDDTLRGQVGADDLRGEDGNDTIDGGLGPDREQGDGGDDVIKASAGRDVIRGGDGRDTLTYADRGFGVIDDVPDSVQVRLNGVADDGGLEDERHDDAGGDLEVITGTADADILEGGGADDTLQGLGGTDLLLGRGGNDVMDGGTGADAMDGGDGIDTATYQARSGNPSGVVVTLDGAANDGNSDDAPPAPRDAPPPAPQDNVSAERVIGTALADRLVGDDSDNVLKGLQGADEISGLGGDDNLDLGAGADRGLGGAGDDLVQANDGQPDRVSCGDGKNDFATVDLQDADALRPLSLAPPSLPDCEHISAAPVGQLPNVDVRSLRADGGRGAIATLACPRDAARACRGTLAVGLRGGRMLSLRPARFAIRRGAVERVRIGLRRAASGRMLVAVTRERARDGRPKVTRVPLRLRR